jgi:hypothetical protein
METEFFWRKWKRKWNGIFRQNRCGNRSFCFRLIRNFHFIVILHSQSGWPNTWPCHIELSKQPTPTPSFTLSNLDRFGEQVSRFTWFDWVLLHDSGGLLVPIIIRFSSVFTPICSMSVSGSIRFHICFWCFCIRFCFRIKIWKQMWYHLVPFVSAPFLSLGGLMCFYAFPEHGNGFAIIGATYAPLTSRWINLVGHLKPHVNLTDEVSLVLLFGLTFF